jgi:hypothetical protein
MLGLRATGLSALGRSPARISPDSLLRPVLLDILSYYKRPSQPLLLNCTMKNTSAGGKQIVTRCIKSIDLLSDGIQIHDPEFRTLRRLPQSSDEPIAFRGPRPACQLRFSAERTELLTSPAVLQGLCSGCQSSVESTDRPRPSQ